MTVPQTPPWQAASRCASSRYSAIELPLELLYDFPQIVSVVLKSPPNLFETRRLGFRFFLRLARLFVDHGAKDQRAGQAPLIQIKGNDGHEPPREPLG
jgi:hypothetical protein